MGLLKDVKDIGFDLVELGFRLVRTSLYFIVAGIIWVAVAGFAIFIASYILDFKNLFQSFLDKVSSLASGGGDGSCIAQSISYALTCSGIIDGVNNAFPVLITSVIFLFLVFLTVYSLDAVRIVSDTVYKLFNISRK